MPLFNREKRKRTPKEQAERAQLGIFARLAGCAYLIYVMVKLLTSPPPETLNSFFSTALPVVLIILSVFVIGITVAEFVRGLKTGQYRASTYEQAELNEYMERKAQADSEKDPDGESAPQGIRESPEESENASGNASGEAATSGDGKRQAGDSGDDDR